ncbi:Polyisoprenoid-binding protein YceI [Nocardia amikacinitolerans]|uniref:Polyisoprenoid-binding protein YceI n=1 Tax=Nocardia amikacinitolerans TaxID=756689 RepID=A0A285KS17_9NOCA|nr:YceI family protein [Nocardia amikacinitolerans]MCP2275456.1 Polyisoprenoid-binding protein YceI [Nocardia amikacinitolerans]MCP2293716.1 Polyisoprenoid-binding protein YceI [Nocardia amikacinitolerans]MCP2315371.1 Polyisoprenoid-binding protein YceI [Nocardia amikacinitolerans]SNY74637.1 Polyisoprenoid-binding protein YceI [Nocardia amikacinitolerans]
MTTAIAKGLTAGTWVIDPAHSTVGFSVRHLMVSKVRGRFTDFEGKLVIGEDGAASAEAEIRVNSLTTDNEQRDAHLRTADFFHAEQFPLMTFKSTGFRVNGEEFVVDGEFTIRGNTKPVSLNVEFLGVNPGMGNGPVAGFEAKTVVSRREFGLDIDMPLPDGGAVIGDKVTLTLEIEAGLQS